jgi:hypothetical protein
VRLTECGMNGFGNLSAGHNVFRRSRGLERFGCYIDVSSVARLGIGP